MSPLPEPEPTKAARARPMSGASGMAPMVRRATTEEMDAATGPVPGFGSIDSDGRVQSAPHGPSSLPALLGNDETSSPTLSMFADGKIPLEPEFERTELAGHPASLPPPPQLTETRGGLGALLKSALIFTAIFGAIAGYRFWRVRHAELEVVRVTIESKPSGSEIWLDGLPTGKYTPSVLEWDNQIGHLLLFKSEGWANAEREVPAGQGSGVISVELAAVGYLKVATQPAGARLSSGNETFGDSPRTIELPADVSAKVVASLDGFLDATTTVTVSAGSTVPWSPTLLPAGKLEIASDPTGARVLVDGQSVGRTPTTALVVASTVHALTIEANGLDPYRVNASVERGATRHVTAHLADKEEHRLQLQLGSVNHQIEDLQRQLKTLESNSSSEYFANMANLKKRNQIEAKLDKLSQRKDEVQGQIDAHRNELEDRVAK